MSDEPRRWPVTIRPRAIEDIENQAMWLDEHGTPAVSRRFQRAVILAIEQMSEMPNAGSLRQTKNTRLSGLRMWKVPGFRNHLFFYLTRDGSPEVVRLFHGAQNIDQILDQEE